MKLTRYMKDFHEGKPAWVAENPEGIKYIIFDGSPSILDDYTIKRLCWKHGIARETIKELLASQEEISF